MRNLLATVPKGQDEMVAALVRTIFSQTDAETTRARLREVVAGFEGRFDKSAALLAEAEHDVTADAVFPRRHWRKIWDTDALERVNMEIKRRTISSGSPTTTRSSASLEPCSPRSTTTGKSPTAATCTRAPWPYSMPHRPRRSTPPTPDTYRLPKLPTAR
jgi:transposase-like protein